MTCRSDLAKHAHTITFVDSLWRTFLQPIFRFYSLIHMTHFDFRNRITATGWYKFTTLWCIWWMLFNWSPVEFTYVFLVRSNNFANIILNFKLGMYVYGFIIFFKQELQRFWSHSFNKFWFEFWSLFYSIYIFQLFSKPTVWLQLQFMCIMNSQNLMIVKVHLAK